MSSTMAMGVIDGRTGAVCGSSFRTIREYSRGKYRSTQDENPIRRISSATQSNPARLVNKSLVFAMV